MGERERTRGLSARTGVLGALVLAGLLAALAACSRGTRSASPGPGEVVLFTSLDPIFSEPVVKEFERRTGIRVKLVTDAEAAKTVGLVNRLLARKEHPEADVFWNNELGQTLVLKEAGVLDPFAPETAEDLPPRYRDPEHYWTGFAARARVIVYNQELVRPEEAPKDLADLLEPRFRGRVAVARPLFGTTFTHAAVLFSKWGAEKAKAYLRGLKENQVTWVAGNAIACTLVARGEKAVCLTDTDDAHEALLKGAPVAMVYPDQAGDGALLIPNSVAQIRGGPNPVNACRLIEFLVSAEVEGMLARSESVQMPLRPTVAPAGPDYDPQRVKLLEVDWQDAARQFPAVKAFVEAELMD